MKNEKGLKRESERLNSENVRYWKPSRYGDVS
jgi:hypothetical protein